MTTRRVPVPRDPTEVVVEGFTHGGEGVARIGGKAVFVPGTIPGERALVRVIDDRKSWARAELVELLETSPDRMVPPCPYVPECGGCDLQHVVPEAQRRLKRRVVREQLERLGRLSDPAVEPCRSVGPDTGYRNHAQFHGDEHGRLGFHRSGSHEVVPVDHCLILGAEPQRLRDRIGAVGAGSDVAVRAHADTGTAAAVITPGPGPLDTPEGDFGLLLRQPDGTTLAFRGEGVLAEQVAGLTYRFPASGFFQVNTGGAEAIVAAVLQACGDLDGAVTWDLYAGVGLLSLPLAAAGAEVTAVEGHGPSCEWAARNAEDAGLAVTVRHEAVEASVSRAAGRLRDAPSTGPGTDLPDVVVLDPPRTGAGGDVCRDLASLSPARIVYVACDPAALARDARTLDEAGYRLRRAVPLDLFPMTHHVEVVATFTR